MKIFKLNRGSLPKIAVLVTGLAAGVLAVTLTPQAAQATPGEPSITVVAANSTTASATTASATTAPATTVPATTASTPAVISEIHGPYAINSAQCGTCHRVHTAKAPNLLAKGSPSSLGSQQSALCLSCHDGTGANQAAGDWYKLGQPVNIAASREYYSHDAVNANPGGTHTESKLNEFGGVSNRHSECSDCHNPHAARATPDSTQISTTTTPAVSDGWDASGRLAGVSGVSVVNSLTPNAAPAYTFLSGVDTNIVPANLVTREYQLCFKCHSGFTTLPSNAGLQAMVPPKYALFALDKAIEFNPANPSFHPVEAAGKNTTEAMKASLAGTSPYKLWNFTVGDTVRCLNCHASSGTSGPNPPLTGIDPTLPQAGSMLAPHTSVNRGILIRNYRDRVLKSSGDAYSGGDFALCYVCHAEAPFVDSASTATNFNLHARHISLLAPVSAVVGTDIDTPGDGRGKAICAECHYRLHSTTNKVEPQSVDGTRLVNFAPNVQPNGVTRSWRAATTTAPGSCTLTCHGYAHTDAGQQYPALPLPVP